MCEHNYIDTEGDAVCMLCGLVGDKYFGDATCSIAAPQYWGYPSTPIAISVKHIVLDAFHLLHLPLGILDSVYARIVRIQEELDQKTNTRFGPRTIAAYALYIQLHAEETPYPVHQIAYVFEVHPHQISSVENIVQCGQLCTNPEKYLERFCSLLSLPYSDFYLIKQGLPRLEETTGHRTQSLAAAAIYLFYRERGKHRLSFQKVSSVCGVCVSTISQIVRKFTSLNKPHTIISP